MATYGDVVEITDPDSPFYGKRGLVIDVNKSAYIVRFLSRRSGHLDRVQDKPFTEQDIQVVEGGHISTLEDDQP